jgi:hypothetical protein
LLFVTHADVGEDKKEADPDRYGPVHVHLLPILILKLMEKFTTCIKLQNVLTVYEQILTWI